MTEFCPSFDVKYFCRAKGSYMANVEADAAGFDSETSRMAMDNSSVQKPKPLVKMSVNISGPDDGGFTVNRQGEISVKKARAVHIQVMRIQEEDEHLGEDLREGVNPKDRFVFFPIASQMKDMFFDYSRPTFPSPLGMNAGVRSL
uniref:Uncharacterized protein n=1 Tax=Picea sitchensis TaxID=3332 RepID=A9P0T2_PICSI|nr:unknown [Picea sitchensis]